MACMPMSPAITPSQKDLTVIPILTPLVPPLSLLLLTSSHARMAVKTDGRGEGGGVEKGGLRGLLESLNIQSHDPQPGGLPTMALPLA